MPRRRSACCRYPLDPPHHVPKCPARRAAALPAYRHRLGRHVAIGTVEPHIVHAVASVRAIGNGLCPRAAPGLKDCKGICQAWRKPQVSEGERR
jgi:hypothetical protein